MSILSKIVGKAVGKCIANGHKMKFTAYNFYYTYHRDHENRATYMLSFKCHECGYILERQSTEAEEAAIKVLDDAENKKD